MVEELRGRVPTFESTAPARLNGRPAVASRRIAVDGLRIHTWTAGQGEPVVLVHGFGVSGRYMLPLARSLAAGFSVFTPELPGYGRSQKPRVPLAIGGLADALAGCLDALELERPAFVANSMGCQVVTELALRVPERAGPLVLIGPTIDPSQRLARRQLLRGLSDSAREPLGLLALTARDSTAIGIRALLATVRSALADRIEERLPLIEQPTLVLRGGEDRFVSPEWAERVVALLPRGRLVVVPREPHAVHYTRPDLVANVVRELLVEEGEQAGGQRIGSLPHRHVSAGEQDEPGAGEGPLPLLGDPCWHQSVVLAPDEERGSSNGWELGPHVSRGDQDGFPEEGERPRPQSVADDRRQPPSHVVERRDQSQAVAEHAVPAGDSSRRD
jgi:pimeloyl-ACP methyl ester carboxylesterase